MTQHVNRLYHELENILGFSGESKSIDFYISSITEHNPFYSTEEIRDWLNSFCSQDAMQVERIPLEEVRQWNYDHRYGDISHQSGRFFSITGLSVRTNLENFPQWSQPIINQPEIGILGILTKKFEGILYLLMQAKAEPGNVNLYQLSPTVQATRSNYTKVHEGKSTPFLEYFLNEGAAKVLVDQLQSEQGSRFYKKRNRNMIVRVADDHLLEPGPSFKWMTLRQLSLLMLSDNTVNMDARSVVSGISFSPKNKPSLSVNLGDLGNCLECSPLVTCPVSSLGLELMVSSQPNTWTLHTMEELLLKLTRERFECQLETQLMPLDKVDKWVRTPEKIFHVDNKYFYVIGIRASILDREVSSWDQPIIKWHNSGVIGFIMKRINGILHFLVQTKLECGNMDLLEFAPTVQCSPDSYSKSNLPPYLTEVLNPRNSEVILDTRQSEEGGRFFHVSNRNLVLLANDEFRLDLPPHYMWMTLYQLKEFLKFSNYLNVETRSVLACLKML